MLTLIGLGLNDEKDITLKGIEEAKRADKVYIELYTNKWHGSLKNLEKLIGKKIQELKRKDLEDNSKKIIDEAKKQNVVIFVPGDPMVATTHTSLLLDARKNKINTSVIHNASIVSAIGEIGLHIYKFGQTVTIPFPEKTKNQLPESVYDVIAENKKRGLHTLCLLDVDSENKQYMLPQKAVKILLSLEEMKKQKVFEEKIEIIAVAKFGSKKPMIEIKRIRDILSSHFREYPAVLIIPGKLHFTEKEFLDDYS